MFWVLNSNLYRERGYDRLLEILPRMGIKFTTVKSVPGTDRFMPADADTFAMTAEEQETCPEPFIDTSGADKVSGEPEWVVTERDHMLTIVNRERATLGKPALDLRPIRRVETMACGHSDYTRKFAIYCAELVLLDKEPKP